MFQFYFARNRFTNTRKGVLKYFTGTLAA